ncbi:M56 family metallopeptidase [Christensenella timonensis]|uniref:M56 family metallopeptidase n=1 Tax=Christensenella timonensis TaxID=1816678 RepID=UPI0008327211|nr:M56 family metallopeptidase [Christensenella timonensis]
MTVLDTALSVSLYAAVVFCGIMAFQRLFRNKFSPALRYGLWFLLIARLLLPVTLESGFHFITLPAAVAVPQSTGIAAATAAGTTAGTVTAQAAQNPAGQIAGIVWLTGTAAVMAWMAICAVRMHTMIRKNAVLPDGRIGCVFEECKKKAGVKRSIPLRLCSGLSTPALTVAPWPKLLLPVGMANAPDRALRCAMLHELTHYRRCDHLVRMLVNVLKAVWWFNPVVWIFDRRIVMDMETACDSMAVKDMEKQEKKQYANTVLAMFSQEQAPRYVLGMALGSSKGVAEQRIRGIYMKQHTKKSVKLAAVLLAAVLLAACFTTACSPVQAADQDMQPQEPASVIGGADGPTEINIEETDGTTNEDDPQLTELPEEAVADGVAIRANMSAAPQNEERVTYIFTIENNSGIKIEDCKLEAAAVKEGQMGDTFSLENGQKKTMQWTTAKQAPIIVEAVLTFQKDGETKSCKAVLCVPEYTEEGTWKTAPGIVEQPAPEAAVEPTPAPSADEGPVPTPTPAPPVAEKKTWSGNVPRPTADPGPVPTPTPAPTPAPEAAE